MLIGHRAVPASILSLAAAFLAMLALAGLSAPGLAGSILVDALEGCTERSPWPTYPNEYDGYFADQNPSGPCTQ